APPRPGPPRRGPRPSRPRLRLVHRRLRHARPQSGKGAARRARGHLMEIATWLRGLGLERYEAAFSDNEIDWEALPKLTAEDLKDLGVVLGSHRRKLLEAIAALQR